MRRAAATLAVTLGLVLIAAYGWAYWSTGTAVGGGGAAAAASVEAGSAPAVQVAGTSVTVSWAPTTLSNGAPVTGYAVARYDASTQAAQTVLTACGGTVTGTSCTETDVPAGSWQYAVTPVIGANWRGAESSRSATATVVIADVDAPTNSITLSATAGGAHLTANTIYYRGSAAGSLRITNAVSDAGSGPASGTTGPLVGAATGWSHTPSTVSSPAGGPYQSAPFAWATGTTSSPAVDVTGHDVAGNATITHLTFVNDSTAPTAGSVSYADGYAPGRSVSVTFGSGTDAGAGIATRRLQRATAPLTNGSCGSFGSFTGVGPTDPGSPYVDGDLASACYQYRYVVTDRVGNQHAATSSNVAKVGYAGAVNGTSGLVSQWRLGESAATATSSDSFTDTSGKALTAHTGEVGATWTHHSGTASSVITDAGRVRGGGILGAYTIDYVSAVPASADYSVEADFFVKSHLGRDAMGVVGRLSTTATTYYTARWEEADRSWNLVKYVNGAGTYLDYVDNQTVLVGQAYRLRLEMIGSALRLYVNGVLTASATDTTITTAGRAGIEDDSGSALIAKSNSSGVHLDSFRVTPVVRATDSKGTNHGSFVGDASLGAAGSLSADSNTAASFDGVADSVTVPDAASLKPAVLTVEAWVRPDAAVQDYASVATKTTADHWGDGYGMYSSGGSIYFWVNDDPNDVATPVLPTDSWSHVVGTYDGSTIRMYLNGALVQSFAYAQPITHSTSPLLIGDAAGVGNYHWNGTLDEVALYNRALTATEVLQHYQLGTAPAADVAGPTGGSVDATGLTGTGSRYSTSTSLSLALAAGTDPSGMAGAVAELRRATATLTDGSCGTFGSPIVVATGPASPYADTVTDAACHRYEYAVSDTVGNPTTYTSPAIKVDTTAPGAPQLGFSALTNTAWSGAGSTVYYRSTAASGSFTTTATATDASGIASYAYPGLGAGWTTTPGAAGVTTYAWSGTPTPPGTRTVTATNNASLVSEGAGFTLVDDVSAPTAGTVSYPDGSTGSSSVSVTFTTGTDDGSGIGTRLLQRASAPLSGGTCGTFTQFATVPGGTNPTSPFADTVSGGSCYKYQYVVTDQVGNERTASSAHVVKVALSYLDTITATSGLLSHWRLGESTTSSDTFAGGSGATLQSRSGEIAASWTKHTDSATDLVVTNAGRARKNGTASYGALYYSSAAPGSADYLVEADVHVASNLANDIAGVVARVSTSSSTYYAARYEQTGQAWVLYRVLNGGWTWLGSSTLQGLTAGTTYRLGLDLNGSTIRLLVDGVARVTATDNGITAAGRAGIAQGFHATSSTTVTDSAGLHLDNFHVTPPLADRTGGNHGDYLHGATLGVAGAITDGDTAAQFDGVNDHGLVTRQIADDFSIEFWFRSSQGIGTGAQWWGGAGMVDAEVNGAFSDFGVSLRSDGRVVAGVGAPDVSVVSSSSGHNNGAWHHVVFTRTRASGAITLYVDGVSRGTANGSTARLTSPTNISFGRLLSGNNAFAGSLDEVAVYTTALSAATVSQHYAAR